MTPSTQIKNIHPGDIYFGEEDLLLHTLLGSCVSITLWHPKRGIGGLCHYKLPTRLHDADATLNAAYGDEAVSIFLDYIRRYDTRPANYEVGLFGGGYIFPLKSDEQIESIDIGSRNIELGKRLLRELGFVIGMEQVGGRSYRRLSMNLKNGVIDLREDALSFHMTE